jgi:hypothetical protein
MLYIKDRNDGLRQAVNDDLNNGDPPMLMLWGAEEDSRVGSSTGVTPMPASTPRVGTRTEEQD